MLGSALVATTSNVAHHKILDLILVKGVRTERNLQRGEDDLLDSGVMRIPVVLWSITSIGDASLME